MEMKNIIFLLVILLLLSGCGIGAKSYEVFERNRNINIGKTFIPKHNKKYRQIHDENHYIYTNILKDVSMVILQIKIIEKKKL